MSATFTPRSRLGAGSVALCAILLAMLTCGPSGCSTPKADYPHSQNVVLGDDYAYVKNPDVKLSREYWIVMRSESGTHAMFPRPDGDPRIVQECTTKGPLASLFESAALCQSASSATLDRINALTESEAMQTSTFLHQKLRFVATDAATSLESARVEPYPMTDDLLAICKTYPTDRNGTLRNLCDEELGYEERGGVRATIARRYSIEECRVIATRLNQLYGIP